MTNQALRQILEDDVVLGAQALLGSTLIHGSLRARIIEVEAYRASDDPASHAFRGRTKRNVPMFGPAGFAYVYFNYGVHWMLNVTAHSDGDAAAVLVRAAVPLEGLETMGERRDATDAKALLSGPGKLTKAFGITDQEQQMDLLATESELRIEAAESAVAFVSGPRVGIASGKGENIPWRFVEKEFRQWSSSPRITDDVESW